MKRGCAALATLAISMATSLVHAAPQTPSCVAAYDGEQRRLEAGDLLGAREELFVCGRTSCPAVVVRQCVEALESLEPRIPTITLAAKDAAGADLSDVRVSLDGTAWRDRLDGRELPLNPGPHVLLFSTKGQRSVEVHIVAREREKGRLVSAVFASDVPPATASPPAPGPGPVPIASFVLGGTAIVASGVFAYFAATGLSARSALDACSPFCPASERDDARAKLRGADIALAVTVGALGAAVVVYLLRPRAAGPASARAALLSW